MRPTLWFALAAALATALSLSAFPALADPPGGEPGGPAGMEGRLERRLATLGLDEGQQQRVHAILDAAKPERDELRGKTREAYEAMRSLLEQDNPDQAAVLAQADAIGQTRTELLKHRLKTLLAVRGELTPEQRAKLKAQMQEHGGGRWRHWRHGGGPGPSDPNTGR